MFLNNIRLYLADPQTGRLEMRFVCHHCGKEITEEPKWNLRLSTLGNKGKPTLLFWCDDKCKEESLS